ncbi:MAG: sigma-70 family RNA polymerase sigma factor [Solirubrobacteraceae bacterium]|nr:sigma-70 family RNA polymerase sigma factor [Solirubrobacteraceae bacterium]
MADRSKPTTRQSTTPVDRRHAEELFRMQHERIVRLLQARLGVSREVAEDACGLAWLQLLRVQPRRDRIIGWLYTVAKHEAFALLARARREVAAEDVLVVATVSDLDEFVDAREALELIGQLKPQQRLVLLLRAEGHSYRSICELTGRTYTWVNRHISEGRQALRALLDGR